MNKVRDAVVTLESRHGSTRTAAEFSAEFQAIHFRREPLLLSPQFASYLDVDRLGRLHADELCVLKEMSTNRTEATPRDDDFASFLQLRGIAAHGAGGQPSRTAPPSTGRLHRRQVKLFQNPIRAQSSVTIRSSPRRKRAVPRTTDQRRSKARQRSFQSNGRRDASLRLGHRAREIHPDSAEGVAPSELARSRRSIEVQQLNLHAVPATRRWSDHSGRSIFDQTYCKMRVRCPTNLRKRRSPTTDLLNQ